MLDDAILKKPFYLNGEDSLWYDGDYLPVYANTNTQTANLYGFNAKTYLYINKEWSSTHTLSYTYGWDVSSGVPFDHIPPLYGKSQLNWAKSKHSFGLFVLYNAWKKDEEYGSGSSDNLDEATIDGTPSWWTLNLCFSADIGAKLIAQVNLENILDVHYKTFSSGISAPGKNLILSLKSNFKI